MRSMGSEPGAATQPIQRCLRHMPPSNGASGGAASAGRLHPCGRHSCGLKGGPPAKVPSMWPLTHGFCARQPSSHAQRPTIPQSTMPQGCTRFNRSASFDAVAWDRLRKAHQRAIMTPYVAGSQQWAATAHDAEDSDPSAAASVRLEGQPRAPEANRTAPAAAVGGGLRLARRRRMEMPRQGAAQAGAFRIWTKALFRWPQASDHDRLRRRFGTTSSTDSATAPPHSEEAAALKGELVLRGPLAAKVAADQQACAAELKASSSLSQASPTQPTKTL